jgi:hypothetical protein
MSLTDTHRTRITIHTTQHSGPMAAAAAALRSTTLL